MISRTPRHRSRPIDDDQLSRWLSSNLLPRHAEITLPPSLSGFFSPFSRMLTAHASRPYPPSPRFCFISLLSRACESYPPFSQPPSPSPSPARPPATPIGRHFITAQRVCALYHRSRRRRRRRRRRIMAIRQRGFAGINCHSNQERSCREQRWLAKEETAKAARARRCTQARLDPSPGLTIASSDRK